MMGFWDGSDISCTICKQSAPRSRQTTTPTSHRSMFTGRMLFLTPNQQRQSTEGRIPDEIISFSCEWINLSCFSLSAATHSKHGCIDTPRRSFSFLGGTTGDAAITRIWALLTHLLTIGSRCNDCRVVFSSWSCVVRARVTDKAATHDA